MDLYAHKTPGQDAPAAEILERILGDDHAAGSRIDLPSRARPYKTASCVSGLKTCIFSGGAPARGSSHVFIGFQGCPIRLDEVRFGPEISKRLAQRACAGVLLSTALSPLLFAEPTRSRRLLGRNLLRLGAVTKPTEVEFRFRKSAGLPLLDFSLPEIFRSRYLFTGTSSR